MTVEQCRETERLIWRSADGKSFVSARLRLEFVTGPANTTPLRTFFRGGFFCNSRCSYRRLNRDSRALLECSPETVPCGMRV